MCKPCESLACALDDARLRARFCGAFWGLCLFIKVFSIPYSAAKVMKFVKFSHNSSFFFSKNTTFAHLNAKKNMNIVYSQPVVEFVTVATELCAFLEQSEGRDRDELKDRLLKLLPLLYLKAQLLPHVEGSMEFDPEAYVTEQDYNWLRAILADVMGEEDEYEDFVYDEGIRMEETRWQRVSEGLADIYQPVRDFVETYRRGVEDNIEEALWALIDHFELYWGANLVDTLRRLHRTRYIS